MSERLIIFDTTLRDGEQSPGATMNIKEKVRVAARLERLGVDVIEAGFPAASDGDFEAVAEVAGRCERVQVAGLARTSKTDIERAWGAIKNAKFPRIHTFLATSEIHMVHKLRMSPDQVVSHAVEAVRYAKTFTDNVEFSAEDASRSDRDFLCRVFAAVIAAGATTINVPDTVGYAIPTEFSELIRYIMANTEGIGKAVVSVHCHNDLGLATANTLAAIQAGARQAEVTINGIGERAGNASLEEVVMAVRTRGGLFPVETSIATREIVPTSRRVSSITGMLVQPNKAIVGANAFAHEAGIHQDGVLKNPMTYEIMKPEVVGLDRNRMVLGKHSGRHALKSHLEDLGFQLSGDELAALFTRFKDLSDKKKYVTDADLENLVSEVILKTPEVFDMKNLYVVCGHEVVPAASMTMNVRGVELKGADLGNGPIDATFNVISKLTNMKPELTQFLIAAIDPGTDSQGEVTVRLAENGLTALGKGTDPDIVTACAKAFINGLNRLVYLKEHPVSLSTEEPVEG